MTDKEHIIISLTRPDVLDWLESNGYEVKSGLSEGDMKAIASEYGEALDELYAGTDLFVRVVEAVVGDRLKEDNNS